MKQRATPRRTRYHISFHRPSQAFILFSPAASQQREPFVSRLPFKKAEQLELKLRWCWYLSDWAVVMKGACAIMQVCLASRWRHGCFSCVEVKNTMHIFTKQGCIFGNRAEGKSGPKNDAFAYHFVTLLPLNIFVSRSPLTLSPFTTVFHIPDYRQLLTMEYTPQFRAALSERDSQILAPVSLLFLRAHWWRLYALLRAYWQLLSAQFSGLVAIVLAINLGMMLSPSIVFLIGNNRFYKKWSTRSREVIRPAFLVNNSLAPHSMPISTPFL